MQTILARAMPAARPAPAARMLREARDSAPGRWASRAPPASARRANVMRALALAVLLACAGVTWAEGPGSRLRTTPEVPAPPLSPSAAPLPDQKRCDTLSGDRKASCVEDARATPG